MAGLSYTWRDLAAIRWYRHARKACWRRRIRRSKSGLCMGNGKNPLHRKSWLHGCECPLRASSVRVWWQRKAFRQIAGQTSQEGADKVRYIGCDGLEEHGRRWTCGGLLDATIVCPPLSALAIEVLARELQQGVPAQPLTLAEPVSFPKLSQ